jgi:SAM-dependent methyltransferase
VVVIFAALHHFSEPVRLLSNLHRVLKPWGFIAVMCEPCEPDRNEDHCLRDLRKGINEKAWAPEEYLEIFARSGLSLADGCIGGGSLKAVQVSTARSPSEQAQRSRSI